MDPNRASDDLVPRILDSVHDTLIAALDAEGRIVRWNAGAERVTGISAEAAVGQTLAFLYPAIDREDGLPERTLRTAAEQGSASASGWRLCADGNTFWGDGTLSRIVEGDRTVGYVLVLQDRTQLKEAQERMRVSEAMFAGILAIASDAVVTVDAEQRIIFFNKGAEQIFGHRVEDVRGQPLEILIPEHFRPGHAELVRGFGDSPTAARRMGERGQIYGLRSSGEIFPADASISKLEVEGRRIYTAVLRDATERRQVEAALSSQAEELARSNADLEQFAYVASHDLQEPLRMVASYTQLLARRYRGKLDEDAEEFIGYAVDGVTRMQELINDLLAYSRVGTRGGHFGPTPLEPVVNRVLTTLATAIEESGAEVTCDPLPTVEGDPVQLGQLFQNLIGNAIKFRGADPPRVHIGARRGDDEWVFTVRDNGIGIAPEFADRIWVIFQRLHSRDEYPGTGIGLAICKKIVERHGGQISVESEPGSGSTFRFNIPDRQGNA
jgi:PAS domain S-box-containing protein